MELRGDRGDDVYIENHSFIRGSRTKKIKGRTNLFILIYNFMENTATAQADETPEVNPAAPVEGAPETPVEPAPVAGVPAA